MFDDGVSSKILLDVLLGILLLSSVLVTLINVVVDLLYAWLDPRVPAADILKWLPEGSLEVTQVYGKPPAQGALAL